MVASSAPRRSHPDIHPASEIPARRRSGPLPLQPPHRRTSAEYKIARPAAPGGRTVAAEELERLEDAMRVLLAPFEHADVDEWRAAVNRSLRAVSGADVASFQLPASGRAPWLTDLSPAAVHAYYHHFSGTDVTSQRIAARGLEVSQRWEVITPAELQASEFYADWLRPQSLHAAVSVRFPVGEGVAWHWLHYASPRADDELRHVTRLLRTLLPAFRAGVESWHRLQLQRATLAGAVDALPDAALLVRGDGRLVHANPAARALLERERGSGTLLAGAARLARNALAPSAGAPPHATLRGRASACAATAVLADRLVEREPVALVLLRAAAAPPGDAELRARFRLTPRELEVARLVAAGLSNRELATRLAISEATARHHVEKVAAKLGVTGRGKVGPVLRGETTGA